MSISQRNFDSRLSFGTRMNPLVILIALSMITFVVLAFFKALSHVRYGEHADIQLIFAKNTLAWFALSPVVETAFSRGWTLITHAFVHIGFWQLFTNMLWLWCFGHIFIDLTGNRKLIPVFIYGTLAGASAFLITATFLPSFQALPETHHFFGNGAAILAIAVAAVTISPNYKLFPMLNGGISLWIVGIIYLVIDMATIPTNNPALHVAHLAGALAGYLFVLLLRRGFDGAGWMNNFYDWFINLFNPDTKSQIRAKMKTTSFYQSAGIPPYKKSVNLTQKRLDEILDKININGYDKLTEEEKELLKKASKEDFQQ